jgi:hypothetical protein
MEGAKDMAQRAIVAAPSDHRAPYLLGIVLGGQNKWREAAEQLERSVALKDEASARYSLGVIWRYHLKDESKAHAHFDMAAVIAGKGLIDHQVFSGFAQNIIHQFLQKFESSRVGVVEFMHPAAGGDYLFIDAFIGNICHTGITAFSIGHNKNPSFPERVVRNTQNISLLRAFFHLPEPGFLR